MIIHELVERVGWTLVHSLWQGLFMAALLWATLRMVPKSAAHARYFIATFAMGLLILATGITAVHESGALQQSAFLATDIPFISLSSSTQSPPSGSGSLGFSSISQWLNQHMELIVLGWVIGTIFFSMRLLIGLAYVQHLRLSSVPVADEFQAMVKQLARRMSIDKVVAIASSHALQAPVVIGYFKPIVLFPIGMLSGLSTKQVEAVILHELSHIKRHDYLVNVLQSIFEVILFFNPFVWLISKQIRTERENCCDDLAVAQTSDPTGYARTLLQLEEIRAGFSPALSIHSGKYQLHQRIQRIMEKAVNRRNEKSKVWPLVVLVVTGLVSASWMSFQAQGMDKPVQSEVPNPQVKTDTTKKTKKELKSATYSRKSITTLDGKGQPREETTEEFSGDEDLMPLLTPSPLDPLDEPIGIPPLEGLFFERDSLPMKHFRMNDENLEEFMKEFNDEFKSRFKDFYTQNEPQLKMMMEDLQNRMEEIGGRFNEDWLRQQEETMQRQMMEIEKRFNDMPRHEDALRNHEESMREMESRMHDRMLRMEEHAANLKEFDKEITKELVKDGYIKSGEEIETLNWSPDDVLRVNGKKIKPEHKEKYDAIRKKYLVRHSHGKPE